MLHKSISGFLDNVIRLISKTEFIPWSNLLQAKEALAKKNHEINEIIRLVSKSAGISTGEVVKMLGPHKKT